MTHHEDEEQRPRTRADWSKVKKKAAASSKSVQRSERRKKETQVLKRSTLTPTLPAQAARPLSEHRTRNGVSLRDLYDTEEVTVTQQAKSEALPTPPTPDQVRMVLESLSEDQLVRYARAKKAEDVAVEEYKTARDLYLRAKENLDTAKETCQAILHEIMTP